MFDIDPQLAHLPAVCEALLADGPRSFSDLLDECVAHHELGDLAAALGEEPGTLLVEAIFDSPTLWLSGLPPEDLVARTDRLIDGTVFTHRLTADEIAHDVAHTIPDLAAIPLDTDRFETPAGPVTLEFATADQPETEADAGGSLLGPSGWLSAFEPGQLVAFRRKAKRLLLEPVEEVSDGSTEIAALRVTAAAMYAESDGGDTPNGVTVNALLADPAAFRTPAPPVGELLAAAGIELRGAYTGPAGEPWESPDERWRRSHAEEVVADYELDTAQQVHFANLRSGWEAFLAGDHDAPAAPEIRDAIADVMVCLGFTSWVLDIRDEESPDVTAFANRLIAEMGRAAAPALYLRAMNVERGGDAAGAEADLLGAIRLDGGFAPALDELSWYAADRGDLARTLRLMREAGVPEDDADVRLLQGFADQLPTAGRNEPCPCGSGRKFKACCQRTPKLPPSAQFDWLEHRVVAFTGRMHRHLRLLALAMYAADDPDNVDEVTELTNDPAILDIAVHEGGGIAEYLAERGPLLAEHDVEVLRSWATSRRRLWEITDRAPGVGLSLTDDATGTAITVADPELVEQSTPAGLLLAVAVTLPGAARLTGIPMMIGAEQREQVRELLASDPGPEELARLYVSLQDVHSRPEPPLLHQALIDPRIEWSHTVDRLGLEGHEDETSTSWELYDTDGDPVRDDAWIAEITLQGGAYFVNAPTGADLEAALEILGDDVEVVSTRTIDMTPFLAEARREAPA